ncbi:MAG: hypothetical protein H6766_01670 [Candidatus Peribacteria bacterium]|nr:MAG: hypothetical protein H6766_01670 [Candidatus Peribacteria bacterium]
MTTKTLKYYFLLCASIAAGVLFFSPTYASTLDCSTATNINVPVAECQALLDLYDSTDGANWYTNTNWDTDSDICGWYGLSCDYGDIVPHVNQVSLGYNNLIGTLPASLADVTYMQYFSLSDSGITGSLPDSRSAWSNIYSFQISDTQLTGSLPDSWSAWSNINDFDVRNNQISGVLPDSWSAWSNIYGFYV